MTVDKPPMPRRTEGSIGAVFVHKISIRRKYCSAKLKEFSRTVPITKPVERNANVRGITRPDICIGVTTTLKHVGITGRDDTTVLVNMGAHIKLGFFEEIDHVLPKSVEIPRIPFHPCMPVIPRRFDDILRGVPQDMLIQLLGFFDRMSDRKPVMKDVSSFGG